MLRTLTLILALSTGAAAAQEVSTSVVLKERLVSADAVITLSDLFDITGEAGDVQLARAPAPGRAISLDPDFVRNAAAREGFHWANAGGVLRVTVEREARTVSASDISDLVQEALYVETGHAYAVNLSNMRQDLFAPADALGGPELISFDHDASSNLFRAQIATYPGGEPLTVAGRAQRVTNVPVLNRTIARGETITAADVDWVRLPESQVRGEILLAEADLVGMSAKRALSPERPLRSFDVEPPILVARGELVSLVYQVGPLMLSAQARALENGGEGQFIRFLNLQSNRTVEAWVEAPGRASVLGGRSAARPSES
ncbi:MAG: flagella basal body P-ring formation protein FlgA [Oceanicaulis sp.]|uniref:flagellar basal body P-ring formation chaperone FlgA n=1 Tax=Oceanicaulis sp. UBA2681 TaxID=1947007 RepID=UPI000C090299|nr:flagellar basal body P-ring formation chaperone FlgA [Oceanicaulis sp. UBA2681]MAP47977.1 flagella basal body P-ring formation protein FlgA [Oceanicaulis sp.]HCR67145.1 flagella basal body P-ring formation protein FlgA [Oceanicaulis sp.]|tara:strand:- start:218 stop:1165 length:948 start_codon:yes stop_codon:yes gene_type:complete